MSDVMEATNIQEVLSQLGIKEVNSGAAIGKHWFATRGEKIESYSPVDGKLIATVNSATSAEYEACIAKAQEAFKTWSKLPKKERYDHIMRLADEIEAHFDEMVEAESKDNGKPEWLARAVDIPRASERTRRAGGQKSARALALGRCQRQTPPAGLPGPPAAQRRYRYRRSRRHRRVTSRSCRHRSHR